MTYFPHDPHALYVDMTIRAEREGEGTYRDRMYEILLAATCPEDCDPQQYSHNECQERADQAISIIFN